MKGITRRQRQVLNFIQDFLDKHNHSPSYRDIQEHLGINNVSAVHKHIHALARKKYISLEPHCSRSIMPTSSPIKKQQIQDKQLSVLLPFIGTLSFDNLIETFASPSILPIPKFIMPHTENAYVLQVKDNSFVEEQVCMGDYLIIQTACEPKPNDIILASIELSGISLRRVEQYDSYIVLSHLAHHGHSKKYPLTDIHIHAVVKGIYRAL